nr:engulfment and cell motility 2 [Rousettus aegyptiacus]
MANAFAQKHLRSIILNHVIRGNRPIKTEMAHQLYVLQVLTFNLLEERMMTKMDPNDQAQRDIIFELRRIAFDAESDPSNAPGSGTEKRKAMYTKDYKMLGFTNHINPAMDFTQTPPGMLALDNMLYLAKVHQDTYIRIVLENSSREDKHECPFGRSAIELTKMLCEILQVGELPNEGRNDYHPMFFTHDRAFEELFGICIQLLNKTWKEMRATAEDFNKVMQVVREQITRALPSKPSSLDQFKSKLRSLSYSEILRLRQSERMSQDDFQSPPIVELREKIQPEILELIKQQRLNRLCEGSSFRKIGNRRRQERFWYCRLALNHKVLHYGDLDDNPQGEVTFESLQEKIPVADIKAIVTGKDCPHMKEKSALKQNKEVLELAFSILYDPDETLNFIAPNKYEYCIWIDGLSALLGKDMSSELTKSDLDTLLSMEMKLRLLDLENIQIPEAPPPVPKEPSSYDFVYHYG